MSTTKPTIVIVPGAWQRSVAFEPFAAKLRAAGYAAEVVSLPSVGGTELPLTGLAADVAAVRAAVQPLVYGGRDVVLLAHSAGGVSGSAAARLLDAGTRRRAGLRGGVVQVVYMSAFMVPKGQCLLGLLGGQPLPWMVMEGDRVTGHPDMVPGIALQDLAPGPRAEACAQMTHTSAALFAGEAEFEPWAEGVPCAYIHCTEDGALPYPLQLQMAAQLGPAPNTATVAASHCPFLSVPDDLLAAVDKVVAAAA